MSFADIPYHNFTTIICVSCQESFAVPLPCGNRFCTVCNFKRLSLIRHRIKYCIDNNPFLQYYEYKLLTLTVRSQKNLPDMIRFLQKSFRRLRQTKEWGELVAGGAFVIEVKKNSWGFHAHIHAIIYSRWFSIKKLQSLWFKASCGSRGVDIRKIPQGSILYYLTKYITKPGENVVESDLDDVNFALKGTRLFQPFGNWHGLSKGYKKPVCHCKNCDATGSFEIECLLWGRGNLREKKYFVEGMGWIHTSLIPDHLL